LNKSICALTLLSVLNLTACGGGAGQTATNATDTTNPTTPSTGSDTGSDTGTSDQDTIVSDSPTYESPSDPAEPGTGTETGDSTSGTDTVTEDSTSGTDTVTEDSTSGTDTVTDGSTTEEDPNDAGQPTPVNPTLVANDDSYNTTYNTAVAADGETGVMSNDAVDASGGYVSVVTAPTNGSLQLETNGAFSYTPEQNFSGLDAFTYSVTDEYGNAAEATVTITVAEPEIVNNGFTPIVASEDTIAVYVSSSEGLDSNDGLTVATPVKTLDKAFSLVRAGAPDHVLLKRGDVWVDEDLNGAKSGRSKDEPAVVAFYGESGDRPKLKTSGETMNKGQLHHVHFMGLNIEAYKMNPADPAFDGGYSSANIRMVGDFENILFEDMKLRFVEFVIQGWDGNVPRNVHIRRSIILDKYTNETSYHRNSRPSGIYTDSGEGLTVEESVWDHNGWNAEVPGAAANMYNHNLYISEKGNVGNKIVVRNNIITRGSALGVHGRPGGLYENNFFGRNPIGLQMGYFLGPELAAGTIAYARNNVVTEGLLMGRGIDACNDPDICTKAIWGIQVENLGQADVRVEGNIVSNRQFQYEGYVKGIRDDEAAVYTDNIVYRWDSEDQGTDAGYPDPGRTVADYNASLGGEASFEAFINTVRNRGLQEWDERYTADAVNDYIREGFGR
jgi:hypothetical protein